MQCEAQREPEIVITYDIVIAARSQAPVLLTGPMFWSVEMVWAISQLSGRTITVLPCDRSDGVAVADGITVAGRDDIVWAREVGRLDEHGQRVLLELLNRWSRRGERRSPQLVASSSVNLLARVRAGEFDRELFYAMKIHIADPRAGLRG